MENQDAIYMARVWKSIRENGWSYVAEHGDVDGIDFVANRILEAAQQGVQLTGLACPACGGQFVKVASCPQCGLTEAPSN